MRELIAKIVVPSFEEIEAQRQFITDQIEVIGSERINQLAKEAARVRLNAYEPYSHYKVGAALLTRSGGIFTGCNSEAISWTQTDHAETSSVTAAVKSGEIKRSGRTFITALAIAVEYNENNKAMGPCGNCLQRIAEHADNCILIDADDKAKIHRITSLRTLFPYGFSPETTKI